MTKAVVAVCASMVVLASTACGGGPASGGACSGAYNGQWNGAASDSVNLSNSCAFHYSGVGCSSIGTYTQLLGASGTTQIDITSSTGGNCLAVGVYSCGYTVSASALAFDCGAGVQSYGR